MHPLVHSCFDDSESKPWLVPLSHTLAINSRSTEEDLDQHVAIADCPHLLQETHHTQQQNHAQFSQLGNVDISSDQPQKIFINIQSHLFTLQDTKCPFLFEYQHNDHLHTTKRHNDTQFNTNCSPPLEPNLLSKPPYGSAFRITRRSSLPAKFIKKMANMKVLFTTTFDRQRKDKLEREHMALVTWQQTFLQSLIDTDDQPTQSATSIQYITESPPPSTRSNSMPPSLSPSSCTLSSMWTFPGSNININNSNSAPPPLFLTHGIDNVTQNERSSKYARFIIMELLSTEETYLEDLYLIKTKFMDPLIFASQQSRPIINNRDIEIIFAFIPQLLLLSITLVQYLKSAIHGRVEDGIGCNIIEKTNNLGNLVGSVLYFLESSFDIYIFYTVNFEESRKCLGRIDCDTLCRRVLLQDRSIRRKETKRMNLSDFLIAPIQRITRYCLTLKDLQKHSPPSPLLDRSLKCMLSLAFTMNEITVV